jgi:hypothetical protein
MSVLFVGDSQLKYLHHVLDDVSVVRYSSGFRVEQMWALLCGIVSDFQTIAIHVGTNNIPDEDPSIILYRYRYLLRNIWEANPGVRIIASGILPRDFNCFEGARNNVRFIDRCNRKAVDINAGLRRLAATTPLLEFCPHHTFGNDRRTANRYLLSRDGLHLMRRGIQQLKDDIVATIARIRPIINKDACDVPGGDVYGG